MKPSNESEQNLVNYLELLRNCVKRNLDDKPTEIVYAGIGDLLLQHAKFYAPPATSFMQLTPKACFANAQYMSQLSERGLRYVEGYAVCIIPVHHAWCVDENDNVVEVTWKEPGVAYFGLEFPKVPKKFKGSMMDNGNEVDLYLKEWK